MIVGSCLCKAVRWRYRGSLDRITHCHCNMCRKAHASAFASYAIGVRESFEFTSGENAICEYASSPSFVRSFCTTCGAVAPNTNLGDIVAMPAGGLDGDLGIEPSAHIFARWKAPWHWISDDLPQHDNYPGEPAPAVARGMPDVVADGLLRGSCLCGDVAFEMSGEFASVHNCHCSRCRKALAAAHATNGFAALDAVRFTQGAEQLAHYRLAAGGLFSQVFCPRCGSGMPQLISEIKMAMVPFGSLDDDPKRGADDHIFVGSKSTWYPITDDLPQLERGPQ